MHMITVMASLAIFTRMILICVEDFSKSMKVESIRKNSITWPKVMVFNAISEVLSTFALVICVFLLREVENEVKK